MLQTYETLDEPATVQQLHLFLKLFHPSNGNLSLFLKKKGDGNTNFAG